MSAEQFNCSHHLSHLVVNSSMSLDSLSDVAGSVEELIKPLCTCFTFSSHSLYLKEEQDTCSDVHTGKRNYSTRQGVGICTCIIAPIYSQNYKQTNRL